MGLGFRLVLALLGFWMAAPAPAEDGGDYRLGPGDKIHISVLHEEKMDLDVLVSQQGTISFPVLGQIQVSGKTSGDLEAVIRQKLSGSYLVNPVVNVNILEHRPIYVGGAVEKPGAFPYAPGMTVQQAIALAGGISEKGGGDVLVTREGQTRPDPKPVGLESLVSAGDHLEILSAEIVVDGEVKSPGVYPYSRGMTVSKAIALAGGRTERASRTIVRVRANDPDHVPVEVGLFDPLVAGDLIRVEESFF